MDWNKPNKKYWRSPSCELTIDFLGTPKKNTEMPKVYKSNNNNDNNDNNNNDNNNKDNNMINKYM